MTSFPEDDAVQEPQARQRLCLELGPELKALVSRLLDCRPEETAELKLLAGDVFQWLQKAQALREEWARSLVLFAVLALAGLEAEGGHEKEWQRLESILAAAGRNLEAGRVGWEGDKPWE